VWIYQGSDSVKSESWARPQGAYWIARKAQKGANWGDQQKEWRNEDNNWRAFVVINEEGGWDQVDGG